MSNEELQRKTEDRYGTDIHSFGQQRDGYIVGYRAAESELQQEAEKWKSIAKGLYISVEDLIYNRKLADEVRPHMDRYNAAIKEQ